MKMSLLLALAFTTGVLAGPYEAPKVKVPNSPDTSKIEAKTADWQEMNDTKLSKDETPVREVASGQEEEAPVDLKERGPSSNTNSEASSQRTVPVPDADQKYQEKIKFWKYERERPHSRQ